MNEQRRFRLQPHGNAYNRFRINIYPFSPCNHTKALYPDKFVNAMWTNLKTLSIWTNLKTIRILFTDWPILLIPDVTLFTNSVMTGRSAVVRHSTTQTCHFSDNSEIAVGLLNLKMIFCPLVRHPTSPTSHFSDNSLPIVFPRLKDLEPMFIPFYLFSLHPFSMKFFPIYQFS